MWWQRHGQQQGQPQQGGWRPPLNPTPMIQPEPEAAMPYGQLYHSILRNGFGSNFGFVNYHPEPSVAQQAINSSPLYNSLMRGG